MSLETVDPGPLPPSVREMQDAILAFADEFYNVEFTLAACIGTPADMRLLQLAERLLACRPACPETRVAGQQGVFPPETTQTP